MNNKINKYSLKLILLYLVISITGTLTATPNSWDSYNKNEKKFHHDLLIFANDEDGETIETYFLRSPRYDFYGRYTRNKEIDFNKSIDEFNSDISELGNLIKSNSCIKQVVNTYLDNLNSNYENYQKLNTSFGDKVIQKLNSTLVLQIELDPKSQKGTPKLKPTSLEYSIKNNSWDGNDLTNISSSEIYSYKIGLNTSAPTNAYMNYYQDYKCANTAKKLIKKSLSEAMSHYNETFQEKIIMDRKKDLLK